MHFSWLHKVSPNNLNKLTAITHNTGIHKCMSATYTIGRFYSTCVSTVIRPQLRWECDLVCFYGIPDTTFQKT